MKKIYLHIFFFLAVFSFSSCSDWLDIEPDGQATNDKLTETGDGYRSMLSGIYKAMTSANLYGREMQFGLVDCMSCQYSWDWYTGSGENSASSQYIEARKFNYYNTSLRGTIDALWKDGYNVIANANNLIQTLQAEKNLDKFAEGAMERDMILGEAYACRALMHFDLCRLFAPAPVENETGKYLPYVDTYPNIQPEAIEVKPFLEKVVADFKKAQELTLHFDSTMLGMSVNSSANARFYGQLDANMEGAGSEKTLDDFYLGRGYRLNYYNIEALLARVYQYMGEDELAFQCAKNVMEFKAEGYQGQTYEMFTADDWYTISSQINVEKRTDVKVVSNLIFALYNEESYEDYDLSTYFYKESSNSQFGNSQWLTVDIKGQSIFLNTDGNDEHNADYRCKFQMFTPEYNRFQDDGGAEEGYPNSPYRLTTKWYCSEDETVRDKNAQLLPIIRATEMRYIMAEHYARIGQYEDAYEILRQIREKRGLYNGEYPLSTKNSLDGFLADMIRDAQREWISEGQLFYLYKRLGAKVVVKSGEAARKLNKSEYMLPIPDNQNM